MFSVRLVTADSYQASPLPQLDPIFSEFRGSEIKHVPVIRIFGTTPTGEKTCLHIHGAFPYMYVPYTGEENEDCLAYKLAASLDAAINISLGSATSKTQHVYKIQRVAGIPFYGYHTREHQFLKIFFYNPAMVKKAADLLQNGSILNKSLQPHEAHIPFILQFMMDYNIHGMNLINLSNVKYRRVSQTMSDTQILNESLFSPNENVEYLPNLIQRQSTSKLEVDALVSDILNREELEKGIDLNPGLAFIWEEERARRGQAGFEGGDSQLVNPKSPERPAFCPTDSDLYQGQRLARRLLTISQCDESSLSSTNSTAYPLETQENHELLNASNLGSTEIGNNSQKIFDTLSLNSVELSQEPLSSQSTLNCSVLDSEDLSLVELLEGLARDSDIKNSADEDSVLGSQKSAFDLVDEKSDASEDEVADLNMTCSQLDSLSSWNSVVEKFSNQKFLDKTLLISTKVDEINMGELLADDSDSQNSEKSSHIPQLDGAGDLTSNIMDSEDEDNTRFPGEVERENELVINKLLPSTDDQVVNKSVRNNSSDDSASPSMSSRCSGESDSTWSSSALPNVTYLPQYGTMNYDQLDEDFLNDFEKDMNMSINLSSVDESVISSSSNGEDELFPLDGVLNGDPCFTQTAELDKSDLAELQDQYVSLLGNSLVPEVYKSLQDSDNVNSRVLQLETKKNHRPVISNRCSSSSENITPNIPESNTKVCNKNKLNQLVGENNQNCKDIQRLSQTDNSDYNFNVVATWEELQDVKFLPKRTVRSKCFGRWRNKVLINRSLSDSMLARRRGLFKRNTTNLSNQVNWTEVNDNSSIPSGELNNSSKELIDSDIKNDSDSKLHCKIDEKNDQIHFSKDDRGSQTDPQYLTYPIKENEILETSIIDSDKKDIESPTVDEENLSSQISHYSSERSLENASGKSQHRHCIYSFVRKGFVRKYAFNTNQMWVIGKRNREGTGPCAPICKNACGLPIVSVEKLNIDIGKINELNNDEDRNISEDVKILQSDNNNMNNNIVRKVIRKGVRRSQLALLQCHPNGQTQSTKISSTESEDGPVIIRRIFEEKVDDGSESIKKRSIILKLGDRSREEETQTLSFELEKEMEKTPALMEKRKRGKQRKDKSLLMDKEMDQDKPRKRGKLRNNISLTKDEKESLDSTSDCVDKEKFIEPKINPIKSDLAISSSTQSNSIGTRPQLWCQIKKKKLNMNLLRRHMKKPTKSVKQKKNEPQVSRYKLRKNTGRKNEKNPSVGDGIMPKKLPIIISDTIIVEAIGNNTEVQQFDNFTELCDAIYKNDVIFETDEAIVNSRNSTLDCTNEQESERYTNAIAEANFYSGKDYTIDAVSQEIPQYLFEEDSREDCETSRQKISFESNSDNALNLTCLKKLVEEIEANSVVDSYENSSAKSFGSEEFSDRESGILMDDSASSSTLIETSCSPRSMIIDELANGNKCDCTSFSGLLTPSIGNGARNDLKLPEIDEYCPDEKIDSVTKSILTMINEKIIGNTSEFGGEITSQNFLLRGDNTTDTLNCGVNISASKNSSIQNSITGAIDSSTSDVPPLPSPPPPPPPLVHEELNAKNCMEIEEERRKTINSECEKEAIASNDPTEVAITSETWESEENINEIVSLSQSEKNDLFDADPSSNIDINQSESVNSVDLNLDFSNSFAALQCETEMEKMIDAEIKTSKNFFPNTADEFLKSNCDGINQKSVNYIDQEDHSLTILDNISPFKCGNELEEIIEPEMISDKNSFPMIDNDFAKSNCNDAVKQNGNSDGNLSIEIPDESSALEKKSPEIIERGIESSENFPPTDDREFPKSNSNRMDSKIIIPFGNESDMIFDDSSAIEFGNAMKEIIASEIMNSSDESVPSIDNQEIITNDDDDDDDDDTVEDSDSESDNETVILYSPERGTLHETMESIETKINSTFARCAEDEESRDTLILDPNFDIDDDDESLENNENDSIIEDFIPEVLEFPISNEHSLQLETIAANKSLMTTSDEDLDAEIKSIVEGLVVQTETEFIKTPLSSPVQEVIKENETLNFLKLLSEHSENTVNSNESKKENESESTAQFDCPLTTSEEDTSQNCVGEKFDSIETISISDDEEIGENIILSPDESENSGESNEIALISEYDTAIELNTSKINEKSDEIVVPIINLVDVESEDELSDSNIVEDNEKKIVAGDDESSEESSVNNETESESSETSEEDIIVIESDEEKSNSHENSESTDSENNLSSEENDDDSIIFTSKSTVDDNDEIDSESSKSSETSEQTNSNTDAMEINHLEEISNSSENNELQRNNVRVNNSEKIPSFDIARDVLKIITVELGDCEVGLNPYLHENEFGNSEENSNSDDENSSITTNSVINSENPEEENIIEENSNSSVNNSEGPRVKLKVTIDVIPRIRDVSIKLERIDINTLNQNVTTVKPPVKRRVKFSEDVWVFESNEWLPLIDNDERDKSIETIVSEKSSTEIESTSTDEESEKLNIKLLDDDDCQIVTETPIESTQKENEEEEEEEEKESVDVVGEIKAKKRPRIIEDITFCVPLNVQNDEKLSIDNHEIIEENLVDYEPKNVKRVKLNEESDTEIMNTKFELTEADTEAVTVESDGDRNLIDADNEPENFSGGQQSTIDCGCPTITKEKTDSDSVFSSSIESNSENTTNYSRKSKSQLILNRSKSSTKQNDVNSLITSSRQDSNSNQVHNGNKNCFLKTYHTLTAYRNKIHTLSSDERLILSQIKSSDVKLGKKSKKDRFLHYLGLHTVKPRSSEWNPETTTTSFIQLQEPQVVLERLSPTVLKCYGYNRRLKSNKKFGKRFQNFGNQNFRIPAYDGAADLSSSDSESEEETFVINTNEKRTCVYTSGKKTERVTVGTPKNKRKISDRDCEVEAGESAKFTPKKRTKSSTTPRRTSMLKSPGGLSRNYTPLKIIVTSPKVHRDNDANHLSNIDNLSSLKCNTNSRNIRLHENFIRQRVASSSSGQGEASSSGSKMKSKQNQQFVLEEIITNTPDSVIENMTSSYEDSCNSKSSNIKDSDDIRRNLFLSKNDEISSRSLSSKEEKPTTSTDVRSTKIGKDDKKEKEDISSSDGENTLIYDPYSKNVYHDYSPPIKFNSSDENDDDDDIFNITFTQYIESQIIKHPSSSFSYTPSQSKNNRKITIIPKFNPPTVERVINTMEKYGIPKCKNLKAFFSNQSDVTGQKKLAQTILKVSGKGNTDLMIFKSSIENNTGINRWRNMKAVEFHPSKGQIHWTSIRKSLAGLASIVITPLISPPTQKNVQNWLKAREYLKKKEEQKALKIEEEPDLISDSSDSSIVECSPERKTASNSSNNKEMSASLKSMLGKSKLFNKNEESKRFGFSYGQIDYLSESTRSNVSRENMNNAKALTTYQYITLFCLEVHVNTRGDLLPDPQYDSISALFYAVKNDVPPTSTIKPIEHGVIIVNSDENKSKLGYDYGTTLPFTIIPVGTEEELFETFIKLVLRTDPEIFLGWEIESLSWGYIFQRATKFNLNLAKRISRIPSVQCKWENETPDLESLADVKLPGRIVLDIWRIMRCEMALLTYTFENVLYHVMNERVPCPSFKALTNWWISKKPKTCWKVVQHYSIKVLGILRILEQLDIIGRTSEHARLFGIQFYEVFSRGSQYRVESIMLRLAKPLNYIAVSPSAHQRACMRAMEALPLIMEPESMFYTDPLIVLDFQSLYPSIIIAHNYCFSTCLGRIENIGQQNPFEFGASVLRVTKSTALKLEGKVNYSPCGVAFVKPEIRLGILPRMLTEILETRFMVKKAMKDHGNENKTLQRVLHSRQHGLKYLANVTYGYTAANFSGRMPCIEVGDAVVSKSKETLERAIKLVESTPNWGARVVYGDTDSLFIHVPGKSKDDAFKIGNEIADAVTASNPSPIKLRFEKVLFPAILQTKKRYCGYMYETADQVTPKYLAKGIETVRRDGCPAVSKILEKSLKILFDTKDVSQVKQYVNRQMDKILRGKVSIQDLTFAKEFRGLRGYKEKACVPALELTRRLLKKDPRALPRHGERVRYIIVAGAPNQALIHCVRSPWEVLDDPGLRPNAIYYITRVIIPPLNRCLNLIGVEVNNWFREMPHRHILDNPIALPSDKQKQTIFQYFGNIICVACGQTSNKVICSNCISKPTETLIMLHEKLRWLEKINEHATMLCQSCYGRTEKIDCISLDCPVLYRRIQTQREFIHGTESVKAIQNGNINLNF